MRLRWSEEELLQLELQCGDRPWPLVVEAYNLWAASNKLPPRTSLALERKAQQLGLPRKSEGTWITAGAVAEILGVDNATPLRWIKRGLIPTWRGGTGRSYPHYIRRTELRKLARQHPCFFRPFDHSQLVMLFDAVAVADYVYEACPSNCIVSGRSREVRCRETGKRYASIKEAAAAAYVTSSRLWSVLDTHETANGLHWESLSPKAAVGRPNYTL